MCELIRAAIHSNLFDTNEKEVNVLKPGKEFLDLITCPGSHLSN